LPYLKFDVEKLKENAKKVNPKITFLKFLPLQEKEWKRGMVI
jgi:Ni2+-binding GTPase involved in maturation of urease and hydrogenase